MKKILNLTQHPSTSAQKAAGVVEPRCKKAVQQLLTFEELPTREEIQARASTLAELACHEAVDAAMIGGAPYLMSALECALYFRGITPLFAFSKRESVEEEQSDGSVRKTLVFRHVGFIK